MQKNFFSLKKLDTKTRNCLKIEISHLKNIDLSILIEIHQIQIELNF